MTENKKTVARYMNAFSQSNHREVLSCLMNDIIWEMPGIFYLKGKEAFDKEIEDDAYESCPDIRISRMTEENNIVVAEGTVKCKRKDGGLLDAVFCDVFHLENGLIKHLTSYMMDKSSI